MKLKTEDFINQFIVKIISAWCETNTMINGTHERLEKTLIEDSQHLAHAA